MSEASPTSASQPGDGPSIGPRGPRSRFFRAGVFLGVVVLIGLLVYIAPGLVARHLLASELDALGIDHAGVDSLSINPFSGELWLGPLTFKAGPSEVGQLNELGLRLRYSTLFDRKVLIEQLLLRGIDIVVSRGQENEISLNGIPLNRFKPAEETTEQPTAAKAAWEAGADSLELRESRLIFLDRDEGELEVEIERLTLTGFQMWEPERPGQFELMASVNDIDLNWSGEARPFADNITLDFDSQTTRADLPKVQRFTGASKLTRQDGIYDLSAKHALTLFGDGRIEGKTNGTIQVKGADYAKTGDFEIKIDEAELGLDVDYTLSAEGDVTLQGKLETTIGQSAGAAGDDKRFATAGGQADFTDIEATIGKSGAFHISLSPDVALETVDFSGPIEISVDAILELLVLLQSLSAEADVAMDATGLGDFSGGSVEVPSSDVTVASLSSRGEKVSLQSKDGRVDLELQGNTELAEVQIDVGDRQITIDRVQSALEQLKVRSGNGKIEVSTRGVNSLSNGKSRSPFGELDIGSFAVDLGELGFQAESGAVSLQLATAAKTSNVSGLLNAQRGRPETVLQVAAAVAEIDRATLDARDGGLRWTSAGDFTVDGLATEFAKGEQGALKFRRAEGKALNANERLDLAAEQIVVDGLDIYVKRALINTLTTGASSAQTSAPSGSGLSEADIRRLQEALTELGYAPGAADGRIGPKTRAAITAFQQRERLPADGQANTDLLARVEARLGNRSASPATAKPAAQPSGLTTQPQLKIGRVALTGKPKIRFRDATVQPNVRLDTVLDRAEILNLDTRSAEQRTDIALLADINEFTRIELNGWTRSLSRTADMDVSAKVVNLELSTYSPYLVDLIGVYWESGQLDTVAVGKSATGSLEGKVDLELDDIAFRPLDEADAERVSGTIGMPLETVVGLLQDNEGRITLTLPVAGTLDKPDVDISDAIQKAVGGALKRVFPPTLAASLISGVSKGSDGTFAPIEFDPGSNAFTDAGRSYTDAVAEMLAEHPKLSLKVCGRSTASDMQQLAEASDNKKPRQEAQQPAQESGTDLSEELTEQLTELAVERKRTVRRYLINERGIEAKRVPECRSVFEAADQGAPRVEIKL